MKEFLKKYQPKNIFIIKSLFILGLPVAAAITLYYHFAYEAWSPALLWGMIIMYALNIFSISAGYHRLFSHRAYKASWPVKLFLLIAGASTAENPVLGWASDHRVHHKYEDTEKDPYNINEGFFFAHMGWIMLKTYKPSPLAKDLLNDKLVMWQHDYYYPIMFISNLIPFLIVYAMTGALVGSFAFVVLLRLVLVHHVTYFINSYCHTFGTKPYSDELTAKDSVTISWLTFGESYHNYHHAFQTDYRNGYRWYNIDATKWILWLWDKMGLVSDLKRVPDEQVLESIMMMKEKNKEAKTHGFTEDARAQLAELKVKALTAKKKLQKMNREYKRLMKSKVDENARAKAEQIKAEIKQMKESFKQAYTEWKEYLNGLSLQAA